MIPNVITAGTTVEWSYADQYAYGLWEYNYVLTGPKHAVLTAEASAGEVVGVITAEESSTFVAGKYQWSIFRVRGDERAFVASGFITVLANPVVQSEVIDHRTHAEKMVEAIEARIEGRIASDYESYTTFDGRSLARIPFADLYGYLTKYRNLAARDRRKAAGKSAPRRVTYRMP